MHISRKLGLQINGHRDLDFVDINVSTDIPLYLDPTLIELLPTIWCREAKAVLNSYFGETFRCCQTKDYVRLFELVSFGREPNETKLGLSEAQSRGKGSTPEKLYKIFESVSKDGLVEKGLVRNPADLCVYVSNFAEDRLSDLVTNVLRQLLYDFTKVQLQKAKQCDIWLSDNQEFLGSYWDANTLQWLPLVGHAFVVDGRRLLLVPKIIVRKKHIVSAGQYLQKYVLSSRQAFHLENKTELTHRRKSKSRGEYYAPPSKKELYAKEVKGKNRKRFVRHFSELNPNVVRAFHEHPQLSRDVWDYVMSDATLDKAVYGKQSKIA